MEIQKKSFPVEFQQAFSTSKVNSSKPTTLSSSLDLCNFGFQGWAVPNVENYPMFWQTLQLPSLG
jgi:hypothetical protein